MWRWATHWGGEWRSLQAGHTCTGPAIGCKRHANPSKNPTCPCKWSASMLGIDHKDDTTSTGQAFHVSLWAWFAKIHTDTQSLCWGPLVECCSGADIIWQGAKRCLLRFARNNLCFPGYCKANSLSLCCGKSLQQNACLMIWGHDIQCCVKLYYWPQCRSCCRYSATCFLVLECRQQVPTSERSAISQETAGQTNHEWWLVLPAMQHNGHLPTISVMNRHTYTDLTCTAHSCL